MRDPKTKVACVKLTVAEGRALDELVARKVVLSRSDALRVGLDMLIERFPYLDLIRRDINRERGIRKPRKATANRKPRPVAPPPVVFETPQKTLSEGLD